MILRVFSSFFYRRLIAASFFSLFALTGQDFCEPL
jgi:hypothetical protein